MEGLGFLIWQLDNMPPSKQLASMLAYYGVKWVSIKVVEGNLPYNGSAERLIDVCVELNKVGVETGGWGYVYPQNSLASAKFAGVRYAEIKDPLTGKQLLTHYMIDIEKEWKPVGLAKTATTYMKELALRIPGVPTYFTSYRFPHYHPNVPYDAFLDAINCTGSAPQVYWVESRNAGDQLVASYKEYQALAPGKEFIPIGSTYAEGDWEPGRTDLKDFIATAIGIRLPAYGFYSLDYIIKKARYDWLLHITDKQGWDGDPVNPEPVTLPDPIGIAKIIFPELPYHLPVRTGPGVTFPAIGRLAKNTEWPAYEEKVFQNGDAWIRIGVSGWMARKVKARIYSVWTFRL